MLLLIQQYKQMLVFTKRGRIMQEKETKLESEEERGGKNEWKAGWVDQWECEVYKWEQKGEGSILLWDYWASCPNSRGDESCSESPRIVKCWIGLNLTCPTGQAIVNSQCTTCIVFQLCLPLKAFEVLPPSRRVLERLSFILEFYYVNEVETLRQSRWGGK